MKAAAGRRPAGKRPGTARKRVNFALQGGGSHGAFAWGILDRLLEEDRLDVEGLSGTSAGSVNAVVLAYGWHVAGRRGAREALAAFWDDVARLGESAGLSRWSPWSTTTQAGPDFAHEAMTAFTRAFSPYQFNPANFNPLRDLLVRHVDFASLRGCRSMKLFLAATDVESSRVRVFPIEEVSVDAVLASSCLPQLFQAVRIDGRYYWDGGYMGNPVLFPLFYETESRDVVILHINPIERPGAPRMPHEIENRLNEITFNASLLKELRAVAFVQKLVADGWIKDEYRPRLKDVLIHSIRADTALSDLSVSSKFANDWGFLTMLRDRGRAYASAWLENHFHDLGVRSTVDLKKEFL